MKLRKKPGIATGYGKPVGDDWLMAASKGNGAPIPEQVANALRGRAFRSDDDFREQFWMEVVKYPELRKQFIPQDLGRMRKGLAPWIPDEKDYLGKRTRYEIHHVEEIQHGGKVFDMDNLRIVTPRHHDHIHNGHKRKPK